MNLMLSAELTRLRIADLHRNAQRDQLARDTRRVRRQQGRSGARTVSGHPASVLTSYALALPGVRPVTVRPQNGFPNNARVTQLRAVSPEQMQTSLIAPDLPSARTPERKELLPSGHPNRSR
jgi:hypothetical protein